MDNKDGEKFNKKDMFKSQEAKDKVQHSYGFSEVDIEEFAAKIETRPDAASRQSDESEDVKDNFVDVSNFEQEIVNLSGSDQMNAVNLFGVPLSDLGQSYRDTEKANK